MDISRKTLMKRAGLLEEEQRIKQVRMTQQMWDKLPFDTRANMLLSAVKDPDDIEQYVDMDWNNLPAEVTQNMVVYIKA